MSAAVLDARQDLMAAFLADAGWDGAEIRPLAGDASNRRYQRLKRGAERAVLMDAPPERGEDVRPFLAVGCWLRGLGLSAPITYAADTAAGFLLIEDLGDALYVRHVDRAPKDEAMLYGAAIRVLVSLADVPPPAEIGDDASRVMLPCYDTATLAREARLAIDWYLPAASGQAASEDQRRDFEALTAGATAPVADTRDVVVLRDFHAENLLWLPDRAGLGKVGLIDYQDALAGHPAYDLVSLLEDARRDTAPDLRAAMLDLYLSERPDQDAEAFRAAFAALGAQRNLKIIGIFARLAIRDGKPGYLKMIPRVWAHLESDLAHPDLAPLAAWVRRHMPTPDPAVLQAIARHAA